MTDRRCPQCNELVPSNSITCPSCYKKIPRPIENDRNERTNEKKDEKASERKGTKAAGGKSRSIAMGLAIIPGVFGFMGLGQMYLGNFRKGAIFLAAGIPMMLLIVFLISTIGGLSTAWIVLALGALIMVGVPYVLLFIIQLFDTLASSMFRGQ